MYDSIKLKLISNETERIPNLLKNSKIVIDNETSEYRCFGKLENLKVNVNNCSLTIEGSFPNFVYGNNFEQLSRKGTEQAIEKLSDLLRLPFHQASVYRLDLAENFILKRPVREYISLLGQARYFNKNPCSDGMYYFNSKKQPKASRVMCFYDKTKEYSEKKHSNLIPEVFQGRNVLRYELRFTKRLKQQFSSEIKAADLYNEDFYINIINRWLTTYFDIKKIKTFTDEDSQMKTVKDLEEYIQILGLKDEIRCDIIWNRLEHARETGEMIDRTYYRCKNLLKRLEENKKYFKPNDCILELDQKVIQAAKYYR